MAWVKYTDLIDTYGAPSVEWDIYKDPLSTWGYKQRPPKSYSDALLVFYKTGQDILKQLGVPPDGRAENDFGQPSFPTYSPKLIYDTLKEKNINLGWDTERQFGNLQSSRGYNYPLAVLGPADSVLGEFNYSGKSMWSDIKSSFLPALASMISLGFAAPIGAAVVGAAAPAAVQKAVGSAIISGASTAVAGGDAEEVIKNALTAGAVSGVGSAVAPYVQDAIDFVKDLAPGDVEQIANSVDATAATGDVANNLAGVEVGGVDVGFDPTEIRMARYDDLIANGLPHDVAVAQVISELGQTGPITAPATGNIANALAGTTAAVIEPSVNAMTGGAVTPTTVTPTGQVATVDLTGGQGVYDPYTGLAENFPVTQPVTTPVVPETGAGLGTAAAGAGALGAGALGAGALGAETAGAVGTVGGGLTVPPGAGLGDAGLITTPGGLDATVAGGTGITAGTTGGGGLDTSGLALGGALGAGAAAGSALPVGSAAAAGSAITPAAGLTGIKAVDDFLSYLGTPAGAMALSAFGGLAGGYFQGQAAKEAAQTQATAAQNALALQREMFEYQKGLLEPYQQAGTAALGRLTGVMGLGGQPATGGQQMLEMDPGYAFRLGEGMKALERLQAARGNMLSGGAIKAGQRFAQDVASQEYGSAYNRLANIAGLGQTTGTQLGAAGQQFGTTAGETMAQQANALAAGRVGRTSAYTQGINTAANAFGNFANQQQQNQLFRDIYGRALGG